MDEVADSNSVAPPFYLTPSRRILHVSERLLLFKMEAFFVWVCTQIACFFNVFYEGYIGSRLGFCRHYMRVGSNDHTWV